MATGVDQAVGMSLVVFSLLLFSYYSVWVIILWQQHKCFWMDMQQHKNVFDLWCDCNDFAQGCKSNSTGCIIFLVPFVDSDHVLHKYFLPREYSVILPGIAAVILLLCVGAFTAVIMWKNRKPKKLD